MRRLRKRSLLGHYVTTALVILGVVWLPACGIEEANVQATIDAAVAATATAQPTPTPDVQATIDAAIAATATAAGPVTTPTPTPTSSSSGSNRDIEIGGTLKDALADRIASGGIFNPTTRDSSGGTQVDLLLMRCRKIWYAPIGQRDLVLLNLVAYDPGGSGIGAATLAFRCRDGEVYPLDLNRFFGPSIIQGGLTVEGSFTVTHPQDFQNVRDALDAYADTLPSNTVQIGGEDGFAIQLGAVDLDTVRAVVSDVFTEALKAVADLAGCYTLKTQSINVSLGAGKVQAIVDAAEPYTLWRINHENRGDECLRDVKYDLVARVHEQ